LISRALLTLPAQATALKQAATLQLQAALFERLQIISYLFVTVKRLQRLQCVSWLLQELLRGDLTQDLLVDVGVPVMHRGG
jgi:hypothetical protein